MGQPQAWESGKSKNKKSQRVAPNSVADPKPCIHMWPTPSSPAKRREPIFEILLRRELGYSLSSIELRARHNNNKKKPLTEELTKSRVSMTYRSQMSRIQSKITQHKTTAKQPIFKEKRQSMEITKEQFQNC